MLSENLARVRARIQQACQRCGRDPASVTLVCVTKGIAIEAIQEAVSLGVTDLGENRVQEARAKIQALGSRTFRIADFGLRIDQTVQQSEIRNSQSTISSVRWHLIGHLQRNKAKDAVELFSVIHSVDSAALAEELGRQAAKRSEELRVKGEGNSMKPLEAFVQVNISGEVTKFGCKPHDTLSLAKTVCTLPSLRLKGLMTIAPLVKDPEQARPHFRRLCLLRDEVQAQLVNSSLITHHSSLLLSMGMSNDFEVAIEEGADVVRVGTAIFKDSE